MKKKELANAGITLIALVVTIIVLLLLAGISITMLTGNNGILTRTIEAKEKNRGGEVKETVILAANNNTAVKYTKGNKETRAQVIRQLHSQGKLTDDDISILNKRDIITIGGIEIDFSVLGKASELTLGDVYTDDMIGQELSYTANASSGYTGKWIVFGKDESGNILITTECPIESDYNMYTSIEYWLKFESYTDETYGVNYACSKYGGTVQDNIVHSRSINMDDINYVTGLKPKTITVDEKTYNIQSFDTYVFGTTNNINEKKVDYWYPTLSGGTLGDGTGNGFWKKPISENETTFKNNWYRYFYDYDNEQYVYAGVDTDGNEVNATTIGLNIDNFQYILGSDIKENPFMYIIDSRSVVIDLSNQDNLQSALFGIGYCSSGVIANGGEMMLGRSTSERAYELADQLADIMGSNAPSHFTMPIRPVVVLPSSLLVEKNETEVYDLVE